MNPREGVPLDDPGFIRQLEQSEVDAWLDLDLSYEGARQMDIRSIEGATLILDRAPEWNQTRLLNLGVLRAATTAQLEAIITELTAAGVPELTAYVSPLARPTTVARLLTDAGLQPSGRSVMVARRTEAMAQPDAYFRIRRAQMDDMEAVFELMQATMASAPDLCTLVASQVRNPTCQMLVAWENAVACSMATIHLNADVAWLPPIWTRPEYRNRGIQAALISHAVQICHEMGVRWITSSYPATPFGRTRNFARLGFEIVYLRNEYRWTSAVAR